MKTKHFFLTFLLIAAATAEADWVYQTAFVNEPALAYNKNYTLDLNTTPNVNGLTYVSAQAVYSTSSLKTSTFTNGSASTATITVVNTVSLSSASATDQITLAPTTSLTGVAATNSLTVASNAGLSGQYLIVNGAIVQDSVFTSNTATGTAVSLCAYLNQYYSRVFVSTVAPNATTIFSTATTKGYVGNSYRFISSSPTALTAATQAFTGGAQPALFNSYLTINGTVLKHGYQWFYMGSSSATATSIATALNYVAGVQASASGSVIFATATVYGSAANAFTLTSSTPTAMTVASPTFTGGRDNAVVTIAGIALTQGAAWKSVATASGTAKAISDAITNNAGLSAIVKSTWTIGGVIFTTSTVIGTPANYGLSTSTPTALVHSGSSYTGGTNAGYVFNSGIINVASHGYSTGTQLLYTTAGGSIVPLTNMTTYYAIPVTANSFELASTSTGAIAGNFITFTSSSTQTAAQTFTLTPLPYAGTSAGFAWYGSNDGVNYNPLPISSVTYSSPTSVPTSSTWDFGQINYRYLQLQTNAPTQGGLNLVVTVKGSN